MKKLILYMSLLLCFTRCKKVLDIENIDNYSPDQVWNDPNLANAYLANLYSVFGNWNPSADGQSDQLTGVPFYPDAVTVTNGALSNWDYDRIRLINQAIQDVPKGSLTDADKNKVLGQAYFLRAYTYFSMVTTHGGVPYLKVPQDRYADSLDIPRNSTKECFDFLIADLDNAIALLPQHILAASSDWGRIDGNFALAFKARVLLYKASPQFNPSSPWGNGYWNDAYIATKKAYDDLKTQGYALVDDYANITLTEKNSEVVFSVINKFPNKVANWDFGVRPGSLSRGNPWANPTWNFIRSFPMKDGMPYNNPQGKYYKTDAQFLQTYWENRDPRFEKSIVWNAKTYPVAGTTSGYRQYTALGIANSLDNFGINPNSGDRSTNNNSYSGFFILKNSRLDLTQAAVQQYDVDYVLMRFAEVMLNYAEAANETGHLPEAMDILRQIRRRAGIEAGTDGNYGIDAPDRQKMRQAIMDERNIELCFEGFRFNDLRRWRMFSVLDNVAKYGVESIAVLSNGTEMPLTQAKELGGKNELSETDFKYSLLQVPQTGVKINVLPGKYYFAPIPQSIIGKTKKLEQNVDWGGTFDPTLH